MTSVALLSWPFVALVLFSALGRERGLIWTVLVGYLVLPENTGFELPGLPDYRKTSAIAVSVVLGAILFRHKLSWPKQPAPPPGGRDRFAVVLAVLFAVVCFGLMMTVLDNGRALIDAEGTEANKEG